MKRLETINTLYHPLLQPGSVVRDEMLEWFMTRGFYPNEVSAVFDVYLNWRGQHVLKVYVFLVPYRINRRGTGRAGWYWKIKANPTPHWLYELLMYNGPKED